MCDRWLVFANFARDMGAKPSPEHSIDRIDNDKGYSPENCRWATDSEQMLNRRTFSNNTSGERGVEKRGDRFFARAQIEGKNYNLGRFGDIEQAVVFRQTFLELMLSGKRNEALAMIRRRANYTSKIGIRGISPHKDGVGFVVRVTRNKTRIYIGYFLSLEKAKEALAAAGGA